MVCFGLSDLRKKKMGLCENSEREKKAEFGASQCFRGVENGGVEEFGGYGIGGTSNGFVTFLFSI